jgi:cyclohexanecarboxylate-CoA ligase
MTAGGSARPDSLHAQTKGELGGVGVLSGYGMTEAPVLTMGATTDPDDLLARCEGRATRGVDLRVVAPDGRVLGPGEEGEIRARGPQVMRGYVDSALDRDAFDAHGYLRTGDLGSLDGDGYLTVTGRIKDIIIRKGENISARALEELLREHPAVADIAVVGLPDAERGELACAVVVPRDPAAPPGLDDLTRFLDERGTARRQWPERREVLDALPRNDTGKVLKTALRQRYGPTGTTTP